jgi:hypothetical protein
MPPGNAYQPGQDHGGFHNQPQGQQGGYQQGYNQQQGYQGGNQNYQQDQQNGQNDDLEKLAANLLPRILKKLDGCCAVM